MTIFVFGHLGSSVCKEFVHKALSPCQLLGVPMSIRSLEIQPQLRLKSIGIELGTVSLELRLPVEKVKSLQKKIVQKA